MVKSTSCGKDWEGELCGQDRKKVIKERLRRT